MSSPMQSFACPSCGGALNYSGTNPTMVCTYCGNTVVVPDELRQAGQVVATQQLTRQVSRWMVLFIILVVGLPICLATGGTLVGVLASIFGIIVSVLAPILAILVSIF